MKMNEIGAAWLRENNACNDGRHWALSECATLSEVWATARPDWLVWVATRPGVLDDRTLWEFASWCAEQALTHWVAAYPDDKRPQQAIEARRGWLRGEVSDEALSAAALSAESAALSAWSARSAAWSAAWSAALSARSARSAARSAAWSAAWSAARSAAWSAESAAWSALSALSAAESAAESAARSAAESAALAAESAAARSAALAAQAQWLRDNATPRFPDAIAQLAATPAGIARACGLENEVEDAQAAVAPC